MDLKRHKPQVLRTCLRGNLCGGGYCSHPGKLEALFFSTLSPLFTASDITSFLFPFFSPAILCLFAKKIMKRKKEKLEFHLLFGKNLIVC